MNVVFHFDFVITVREYRHMKAYLNYQMPLPRIGDSIEPESIESLCKFQDILSEEMVVLDLPRKLNLFEVRAVVHYLKNAAIYIYCEEE